MAIIHGIVLITFIGIMFLLQDDRYHAVYMTATSIALVLLTLERISIKVELEWYDYFRVCIWAGNACLYHILLKKRWEILYLERAIQKINK